MKKATLKQQNIINFIRKFTFEESMAPTIEEIANYFKIKTSTTFSHIRSLQEKGLINRTSKARSIALIENNDISTPYTVNGFNLNIKILGRINAGYAIDMNQNMAISSDQSQSPTIQFDTSLFPYQNKKNELFSLEVTGDSMQEAGVIDGDYIIVKKTTQVKNGDMIVALVNQNETTLKYYYKTPTHIELHPANSQYKIQINLPSQIQIQGIVIGLQRKF